MKRLRKFVILALAVCMAWCMTATVMAAAPETAGEASTFTFINRETDEESGTESLDAENPGTENPETDEPIVEGNTENTANADNTGSTGSTTAAKTADANHVAGYSVTAVAAAAMALIASAAAGRKRRFEKEVR